jgi:hypothetical protein
VREPATYPDIPWYNEACATCGVPADLHRGPDDPPETTPHSAWGWLTCRQFVRCDPPRAAYGELGR